MSAPIAIGVTVNGVRYERAGRAAPAAQRLHPARSWAYGHARRMRARRVWRMHSSDRRRAGPLLHHARGSGRRTRASHGRSARRTGRRTEPAAEALSAKPTGCNAASARLGFLMTLTAFLRDNPKPTDAEIRDALVGESLPLHRLSPHSRGRQACQLEPPYLRARVPRNEDARLLTGRALFVDDVQLPGMLHVAFVRSEHAHGRITGIDVSAAKTRPGVHAVYTAADLGAYLKPGPILVSPPPIPESRLPRVHATAACQRQGSPCRRDRSR